MAKDTFYFQHDYNARNDEKILELRSEFGPLGYGIFWMLIETMAENENAAINKKFVTGLSISYGLAKAELSKIIDYCISVELIYEEDGMLFSKRLLRHIWFRQEKSKERSKSGKKGAESLWRNRGSLNNLNGSAIAKDDIGKERKGKESNNHTPELIVAAIGSEKVKAAANEAWNDKIWIDNTCKAHQMPETDMQLWMYQYNASVSNDTINGFNSAKYKKMFGGWLNTQLAKGYKVPVKPSNGKSQLTTLK